MLRALWGPVCGGGTIVLSGVALGVGLGNGTDPQDLGHLVYVAACAVVGGLISARRPDNRVGLLLLVSAFSFAAMDACGGYAMRGEGVLAGPAGWPQTWLWVPANLALALLPWYFPDGRLPGARRRRLVVAVVGAGVVTAGVSSLRPGVNGQVGGGGVPNPYGVAGLAGIADVVEGTFVLLAGAVFLAGAAGVVVRARRAEGEAARPFKWLAYAVGLASAGVVGRLVIGLTDGRPGVWPVGSLPGEVLGAAAVLLILAAIAIGILRHGLFDIDLLISRTLVYTILTLCVVGGYVLVVNYLGTLFEAGLLVSLVATGIIALVFAPLRERVQRFVHRLMYGQRDEPYAVLTRLGRHLEGPEAMAGAARTVAEALRLPYVAVEVSATGAVVAHGKASGEPVPLPLVHNGRAVGRLLLSPRPGERELGAADLGLLQDLAGLVAVAVHLQQSREEIVTAREEERRRLRRELHDGLGPTLASLTMRAEAVQELMDERPERARTLLEEIVSGTESAIGEVRRLVDGLRPPALDTLGLAGALQAFVDGQPPGGPRIRLTRPDGLPPLGAATEVAAYRIATEAVTNVWRHSGARDCLLALSAADGTLTVEVTDDGRGTAVLATETGLRPTGGGDAARLATDAGPIGGEESVRLPAEARPGSDTGGDAVGVGLGSMRERAVELGGVFTVDAGPDGGTVVRAVLPLGA